MSRVPRQQLRKAACHGRIGSLHFNDHAGASCLSVFQGWSHTADGPILPPRFSLQVYVGFDLPSSSARLELANSFLRRTMSAFEMEDCLRLDMHFIGPQADIHRSAVSHYRMELEHWRARPPGLEVVPCYKEWNYGIRPSFCIVLTGSDWEETGTVDQISFDAPQELLEEEADDPGLYMIAEDGLLIKHNQRIDDDPVTGRLSNLRDLLMSTKYWRVCVEQYERNFSPMAYDVDDAEP